MAWGGLKHDGQSLIFIYHEDILCVCVICTIYKYKMFYIVSVRVFKILKTKYYYHILSYSYNDDSKIHNIVYIIYIFWI